MALIAYPQNRKNWQHNHSGKNRDQFLGILGFIATFVQNIERIGRNHESADCSKERIDLAHALVGDRSGDVHRRSGGNSRQNAGSRWGQAHEGRVPQLQIA